LEQKKEFLRQEEKTESRRQKTLARELEWVRMSPKARQAKGQARLTAYEKLLSQEVEKYRGEQEIYIPPGPRLGDIVLEFDNVTKGYADRLLLENFSAKILPGSIVGVIGPNGAGKTTLLRMITGSEKPDGGSIRVGETVKWAYADQMRPLDNDKNVWQEISGGEDEIILGTRKMNSRAYVASFNFAGSDQQKKVGTLSGGERNRVHLAKTLKEGANVLLLDEPTNDLDVNTLRALEEALENFAGCAIVVSHDRWFLDRICTHILAFEGDSQAHLFLGNWSDYEAHIRETTGKDLQPHRVKYRTLKR
jgi:ATPase subunit of ABC transporter with duplicated ATPase domains